jgi:hypothetical protein
VAKQAALSCSLLIDGIDLSGDTREVVMRRPSSLLDVTAIDKSAIERIYGTVDGELSTVMFFNDAAGQEHVTLKLKPATDRIVTFLLGSTLGNMAAGIVAKQVNYDPTRGADGSLTEAVQCLGNGYGLDYCVQLTAGLRTDTAATNGTGVNNGAASTRGLAAYLEVTAITGTSVTVTIEESSNDGAGDAYAAVVGGAFVAATVPGAQHIQTAAGLAVEQYLRVVTTGTFNPATFSVVVTRDPVI